MKYTVASLTVVALLSGNAMAQRKPNIILFLVDDMGWQDTSLPFWKDTTDLNLGKHVHPHRQSPESVSLRSIAYVFDPFSPPDASLHPVIPVPDHGSTSLT